ncbi:MAG: transporter substrate-binding domain-containing protein, partial [Thermoanaerobaculales bacterium]|nr:transporter substrate-binding domain-containing protein [Thermoanaerobaculales bacterium]
MTVRARSFTVALCALGGLMALGALGCGPRFRPGDLPEISDFGTLRVIVRPGFGEWPGARGLGGVDEVALVGRFAARLGLGLEWVEASGNDEVIPWLKEGRGDMALGRFSPAGLERVGGVVAGATVDWVVDEVVATQDGPVATMEDLAGAVLSLPPSLMGRLNLSEEIWRGVFFDAIDEDISVERVLEQVASGRYAVTVADSALVEVVRSLGFQLRTVGRLAERRPLVWAFRKESPMLRRALDSFLFAERVLAKVEDQPVCRDLGEIRQGRVLRLVSRNSPVTVTVERGGLQGFEYDLVTAFARELGVRLELAIPPPGIEPAAWLEAGHGDIMALHEPLPVAGAGGNLASIVYRNVDLVAVVASRTVALGGVVDLAGLQVAASSAV